MKKIKYLLIGLLIMIPGMVKADTGIVDFEGRGTIELLLKESTDGTMVSGAEISIVKIAKAIDKNNNLTFEYVDEINDCSLLVDEIKDVSSELVECVDKSNLKYDKKITDKNGMVKFNNLELGLYLIKQTNKLEGYSSFLPFLIMIPEFIDDEWNYDIEATPKTDIIKVMDIIVRKEWNISSNKMIPEEIEVQLIRGNQVIDTIKLNKDNGWKYTWRELEASDEYRVLEVNVPDGYTASYRNEDGIFIIVNTDTLIKTSSNTWLIQGLALLGIIIITIGIICEKKECHE